MHRPLGWRLRSSRIPATQPPNSGPEPTLPASQPGPAVLAVMGNRDVATVATFPPNGETVGCGPACPHSLKGDPHGTQQQPLSRGVQTLPARTPGSRAGALSLLAAMATGDRVLLTFKTNGLVTALAFGHINV